MKEGMRRAATASVDGGRGPRLEAAGAADLVEIATLRVDAWAFEGVDVDRDGTGMLLDELDFHEATRHLVARRRDGVIDAAIRFTLHDAIDASVLPLSLRTRARDRLVGLGPICALSRLVVRPGARGASLGRRLTVAAIAATPPRTLVAYTTVVSRARHLDELGFESVATEFVMWGDQRLAATGFVRRI